MRVKVNEEQSVKNCPKCKAGNSLVRTNGRWKCRLCGYEKAATEQLQL